MAMRPTTWLLAAALVVTAACSSDDKPTAASAPQADHAPVAQTPVKAEAPAGDPHGATPHGSDPHAMRTPHPPTHSEEVSAAHGDVNISSSTKTRSTLVPPEVMGKWSAATFILVDRERSNAEEVTVDLEGEYVFADGSLKIFLHSFLPDLKINDDNVYTSVSNRPENPAAHVTVYENGKEVFDGWLFSEFPGIHPFSHPRFGVTLKAGVPI